MSDKKRKAASQEDGRPSKKQQTAGSVKVNHIQSADTAKPVVASAAGTILPTNLKFSSYSKPNDPGSKELLLHSSDHDTIDFTAVESNTAISMDKHLKHYIAVFDPTTGRLDVTEAKKMIVRSQVRQFQTEAESNGEDTVPAVISSFRAALTEAFGTKKAKRAVQSMADNRLLARGDDGEDPLSQAILSTMPGEDDDYLDGSKTTRTNKPLPPANMQAEKVEDAYPISKLVIPQPWKETLSQLSLAYWKERIAAGKPANTHFHFVANRMNYLVQSHIKSPEDPAILQHVQILRYIELVLELHKHIMSLPPKRPIPPTFKWPEKTLLAFSNVSEQLLPRLLSHYFPSGKRSQHAVTLMRTTILALTLHVPPPSLNAGGKLLITEPTDISLDLALEKKEASQLFRELGCKLEPATDMELARWSLSKLNTKRRDEKGKEVTLPKPKFAKLGLPLEFPKLSQGKNISPGKRR